jgi:hypothetical protein
MQLTVFLPAPVATRLKGCGVPGKQLKISDFRLRVQGSGFKIWYLGFRVYGICVMA